MLAMKPSKAPRMAEHSDDEDDLIAFVSADNSAHRRNSKSPKSSNSFFRFCDEVDTDEEADEDEEWDVDESDHSSEDYSDILDMLGLGGCGLMVASLNGASSSSKATNGAICDSISKNCSTSTTATSRPCLIPAGFRSLFSCPFTKREPSSPFTATTVVSSSAVDVPRVFNRHAAVADNSPSSFDSVSPDSFHVQLTEDDIRRNQAMAEEEEKVKVAVAEANNKWAQTLQLWKEEMGEKAYLLDLEEDEKEKKKELAVSKSEPAIYRLDEIFAFELDHTDGLLTHSSPCLVSANYITKDRTSVQRCRSIRFFKTEPANVFEIAQEDECRLKYWEQLRLDRMRLEKAMADLVAPIFTAEHRQRIYQERFADSAE